MRSVTAGHPPITREQADVLTALVLAEDPLGTEEVADRTGLPQQVVRAALLRLTRRGSARRVPRAPGGAQRYEATGVPPRA
ncbi:helix-turn-helix domain-containing protein [Kineococcus sp. SYSU DK006]|uniref:helix-turn-helix domain-containing protein n=1 Tax=Kineococcus sp. SYSU DK006 TaxID=3383127 RepID=UPI003D7CCB14